MARKTFTTELLASADLNANFDWAAYEAHPAKADVRAATTANIALATDLENGDTLDGVTLATGDRVLVKDQTDATQNGIYVVEASGAPARASDAATDANFASGVQVYVKEGTAGGGTKWTLATTGAVTVGTSDLEFETTTIDVSDKANDADVVHDTGDETIAGTKTFSASPIVPTPTAGDNSTKAASTAFVAAAVAALLDGAPGALDTLNELAAALGDDANFASTITTALAAKAPLASPALTGTPTAPTATAGTNTTQIATTAFVAALGALKANLASPTFTGTPAAPTAAAGTNTTQLATTAFVLANAASASATITASEALAARDIVSIWNSGGAKVRKANATDNTKIGIGFVDAAVSSSASATVKFAGIISGLSGLTIGADYFLSTTGGGITTTPPSASGNIVQKIGTALSATELLFAPGAAVPGFATNTISGNEIVVGLAEGSAPTFITVNHSGDADFAFCEYPRTAAPDGVVVRVVASRDNGDDTTGAQFVLEIENVSFGGGFDYGGTPPDIAIDWTRTGVLT